METSNSNLSDSRGEGDRCAMLMVIIMWFSFFFFACEKLNIMKYVDICSLVFI